MNIMRNIYKCFKIWHYQFILITIAMILSNVNMTPTHVQTKNVKVFQLTQKVKC